MPLTNNPNIKQLQGVRVRRHDHAVLSRMFPFRPSRILEQNLAMKARKDLYQLKYPIAYMHYRLIT